MSEGKKSEFTRRAAAAVTRRHSFLTLGGVALTTTLAAPGAAEAGKAARKARKKCKQQRGECRASVEDACGASTECLEELLPCCDPLATCDAGDSTACFLNFVVN